MAEKNRSGVIKDLVTGEEFDVFSILMMDPRSRYTDGITLVVDWGKQHAWDLAKSSKHPYRIFNEKENFDILVRYLGESGIPKGLSYEFKQIENLETVEMYEDAKKELL